ncbi:hypothetical protein NEUTE1DRAFT_150876 [Neurospora tetrasperma FGSC 2508]|uniref:Fucose-specific lectin n=1 Tax=Neurospora tetrasperma (strain FGSC 2508 / ATCC MYA-4615 / P0657) TaxID=510951 RepID=F8N526_NEUT8|nr:uncharacterized protein NEUTE1DRAFT_150876 [Neurospora tetrasperma FGSC 2508]EGO53607.1 hypothetical protein NEUTE1DRAFT_150876 [Neurospora tetrasperma FGSC 2508]
MALFGAMSIPKPLLTLLLVAASVTPSEATMASWWNSVAGQVVVLNETTGQYRYTRCNTMGMDTIYYSTTGGNYLNFTQSPPKAGSPLAGTGWYDQTNTWASLFYFDESNSIRNAIFKCDPSTGLYMDAESGFWPVVAGGAPAPHTNSGIAAFLRDQNRGYRLYYHDENMHLNELSYDPDTTTWNWEGTINHDVPGSNAIAAVDGRDQGNFTVFTPRDDKNIQITQWGRDKNWYISTTPHPLKGSFSTCSTPSSSFKIDYSAPSNYSLPFWTGQPKSIGISFYTAASRNVYYVGSDKSLYRLTTQNYVWGVAENQSTAYWPQADEANAELAVVSAIIQETKSAKVRIYYIVGGKLAEVALNGNDNAWKPWRTVPEWDPNDGAKEQPTSSTTSGGGGTTTTTTTSPSTPSGSATGPDTTGTSATAESASGGGFSSGAKIGVGVGVGLGVVALGVIMAAFFLFRRNNNKNSNTNLNSPEDGTTVVGSEAPSATTSPIPPCGTLATGYGFGAGAGEWDQKMHPGGGGYTNVQQLDRMERPMELDAPRAVFELPDQAYRHELMADHTALRVEAPGHHGHPGGQGYVGQRRV